MSTAKIGAACFGLVIGWVGVLAGVVLGLGAWLLPPSLVTNGPFLLAGCWLVLAFPDLVVAVTR